MFKPNKNFKKKYDSLFMEEPLQANVFLLLCELANDQGEVEISEKELIILMTARFENPEEEYALSLKPYLMARD